MSLDSQLFGNFANAENLQNDKFLCQRIFDNSEFFERFNALQAQISEEQSPKAREEIMTEADKEMAAEVHDLAMALYRYYTYGEKSDLIQNVKGTSPIVPYRSSLSLRSCWQPYSSATVRTKADRNGIGRRRR